MSAVSGICYIEYIFFAAPQASRYTSGSSAVKYLYSETSAGPTCRSSCLAISPPPPPRSALPYNQDDLASFKLREPVGQVALFFFLWNCTLCSRHAHP